MPVNTLNRNFGAGVRRAPRSAAVSITRGEDGPTNAQLLRKAREQVQLTDMDIANTRIRWARNGSVLIGGWR